MQIRKRTTRTVEEILEMALAFFGADGMGLALDDLTERCASFHQGPSYVWVCAEGDGAERSVSIEFADLDAPAGIFAAAV